MLDGALVRGAGDSVGWLGLIASTEKPVGDDVAGRELSVAEQPASAMVATAVQLSSVARAATGRRSTRPPCHAVPMRILGWVRGVSQRMIPFSFA